MSSAILSIGTKFFSSLPLIKKFTIIAITFAIPLIPSIIMAIGFEIASIKNLKNSKQGIQWVIINNQLAGSIAKHRGLTATFISSQDDIKTSIENELQQLENSVQTLISEQAKATKAHPKLSQEYQKILGKWDDLKISNLKKNPAQSFKLHTDLVKSVIRVSEYITSRWPISAVKNSQATALSILISHKLPAFTDEMGKLRGYASSIAASGKFTPESYTRLTGYYSTTQSSFSKMATDLNFLLPQQTYSKHFNKNTINKTNDFLTLVKTQVIEPDKLTIESGVVFNKGSEAIQEWLNSEHSMGEFLFEELELLLKKRTQETYLLLTVFILSSISIFYLFTAFYQSTMNALKHVRTSSEHIANGNVGIKIPIETQDEIGQICKFINHITATFNGLIKNTQDSVAQVVIQANEIDTISHQAEQGMFSQQSQLDMMASAMIQMSSSAQNVKKSTLEAANSANEANQQSKNGDNVVIAVVDEIKNLVVQIEQTSKAINQLANDANNIGAVTDVIKGIAEQTNLLALNAAIEAARAGEQGRGFAVVADEVRTLAQRTRESTDEIQSMISALQTASKSVVDVIQQSKSSVEITSDKVIEARQALNHINDAVSTINSMTTQIATSATEQATTADSLANDLTVTHNLSKNAVEFSTNISSLSSNLKRISQSVENQLANFHTS